MQKKLIALAVAGLASTAAFAQSNVTIYGVADAGYVNANGDNGRNNAWNGIESGILAGSRLGFKGEEALGNGLKAVFTLEYGLSLDANAGVGTALARQQFVGLSSDKLGTVTLGRQYAPGYFTQVRNDAFAGASVGPLAVLNTAAGNTIQAASNARWNNSAVYQSPTWAGFSVRGIYSYGEAGTTAVSESSGSVGQAGLGLNYANGPLNVDLAYQTRLDQAAFSVAAGTGYWAGTVTRTGGQNGKDVDEWMLGASYDFKVVKVFASYQDQDDDVNTSAAQFGNKVWSVGATVPVFGNGKLHASYAKLSWDRSGAGDSKAWGLGYTHALSKRTTLYTTYTSVKNDNDALVAAGAGYVSALDERNGTFAAGISHTF
ncbi:porin [Azospira restricta]|uniref:Porin n=1 Tax=Azospira restricta TaxID=404405 RepID=A0A974Y347_9RHOO|nr:porin [Azospira restricta]QRJ63708.1 porin [Azospira restricta]